MCMVWKEKEVGRPQERPRRMVRLFASGKAMEAKGEVKGQRKRPRDKRRGQGIKEEVKG